jgi:hypothetical protein
VLDPPRRTCDTLIGGQGVEPRAKAKVIRPCGLEAGYYCNDCAMYACSQHKNAVHSLHHVARR